VNLNDQDKDVLRRDRAKLEKALREAGVTAFKGKSCKCPFHEDTHASAGIYEKDGIWKFKCQACGVGGDVFDVRARATGRKPEDVLREMSQSDRPAPARPKPKTVYSSPKALRASIAGAQAMYIYANPTTRATELIVLRIREAGGSKRFIQARPVPGGFILEAPPKPLPIYNRTRIATADTVIVVEGEKCVHALEEIDIVATTSPGGAGKAMHADWSPLAGKTVFLWHDADEADPKTRKITGVEHMRDVARQLEALNPTPRVYWIDAFQFSLPPKGDVVEYLSIYGGETIESARACNPMRDGHR
jgi:hypothetical protein